MNAGKLWLAQWYECLSDACPVHLCEALYSKHPSCREILEAGADAPSLVKPGLHLPLLFFAA